MTTNYDIPWDLAPEGTTHYNPKGSGVFWYRAAPGGYEFWSPVNRCWMRSTSPSTQQALIAKRERPTAKPQLARKAHLDTQYLLTLENDGDLYRRIKPLIDSCDARQFCGEMKLAVSKIATSLREPLPAEKERAYLVLEMWKRYQGDPHELLANLTDANILRPHINSLVNRHTQTAEPAPIAQEEAPVNNTTPTIAFETRHYVYGMDVANMTSGQLIDAIKRVEAEIADLKAVKAKSEHIKKRIAELDAMLVKIVEALDAQ